MAESVVRVGSAFDTRAIEAGFARVQRGMKALDRNTAQLQRGFSKVGRGLGLGLKNAALIGTAAIGLFAAAVKGGLDELVKLEEANAQTAAVLKSTGGAAGITADQVRGLAEKFESLNATIDDKVIQSTENMLLTFTNVRKKAFEPALQAILDMNTAMGGGEEGLQKTAIQVGKALNDPIKGITALSKVGVTFTEDQKKQIKALVGSGKTLDAQKVIIAELNKEFGGSFLAQGNTTKGKIAKVTDAFDDLKAALATGFLPVVSRVADIMQRKLADPATVQAFEDFGKKVAGLFSEDNLRKGEEFANDVLGALGKLPWGTIADGLKGAGAGAKVAVDAFLKLPPNVQAGLIGVLAANKLTGGLVASGIGDIAGFVLKSLGGRIFAANVTVIGTNVIGPGGVPGGKGPGGIPIGGLGAAALIGSLPFLVSGDQPQPTGDQAWDMKLALSDINRAIDYLGSQSTLTDQQKATVDLLTQEKDAINRNDYALYRAIHDGTAVLRNKKFAVGIQTYIQLKDYNNIAAWFSEAGVPPVLQRVIDNSTIFRAQTTNTQLALARGGRARKGMPALVGEEGPELFVPDESGYVVPNGIATARSHGGSPIVEFRPNITVNVSPRRAQQSIERMDIWHGRVAQ